MKKGFTLAEVLITLGIIGVVAAMTIPTLIANTQGTKYRNQYKKAISALSQAARMNLAQYDFDYAGVSATCGNNGATQTPETHQTICAILNANLKGATFYDTANKIPTKDGKPYTITSPYGAARGFNTNSMLAYQFNDGTIIMISKRMGLQPCTLNVGAVMQDSYNTDGNLRWCFGMIDVNGTSLPNSEVSCTSGTNSLSAQNCIVKNNTKNLTDIYPIRFHDGIVEPVTAAARYVLKSAK